MTSCLPQFFRKTFIGTDRDDGPQNRDRWTTRSAFVFAAIGSAVGLGNIWRFPALAYQFGGGAFFVPYLAALFIIGIPLLILELSLGQVNQSGDIVAFGSMNKRLRGVGLASVFGGFMVVCYYNAVISWSLTYFVASFQRNLPWMTASGGADINTASNYFFQSILRLSPSAISPNYTIVATSFIGLLFTWLFIYFCIHKGVHVTSRIVYVTMPLPVIIIIVLFVRGVTLPGASDGIERYIGIWDMEVLKNSTVWSQAVTQIFFSIGVTFGIMTAYASYNHTHQNTVADSFVIGITNSLVSIIAGFTVFSILGFLVNDAVLSWEGLGVSGLGLAFVTYPVALGLMPGVSANIFCALFFLALFFLGIDSAFSLVEAVTTAIKDSRRFHKADRSVISMFTCVVGLLISTLYISDIGLYALDVVDFFVNNVTMVLVGFLESYGAGWLYDMRRQVKAVGQKSVFLLNFGFIAGVLSGSFIAFFLGPYRVIVGAGILFLSVVGSMFLATGSTGDRDGKSVSYWLFLHNIESLREDLNSVVADEPGKWRIPFVWSLLIKYAIPTALMIIWAETISTLVENGGYLADHVKKIPYPVVYQVIGLVVAGIAILSIFIAASFPSLMDGMMPIAKDRRFLAHDTEDREKMFNDQTGMDVELEAFEDH